MPVSASLCNRAALFASPILPPCISLVLLVIGVLWLFLLPLDEYSRHTYISENALLPGQVHTYFGGSEQAIFDAYWIEIGDNFTDQADISARLSDIFESGGLKSSSQRYRYQTEGGVYEGENVFAILNAPRGDATEAVVLMAPWINMDGIFNRNGVALVLTMARYFNRWSLWSKDIIILITSDSRAGPQAWVDAYHDEHDPAFVAPLRMKSGALQGAIAVDNALDHRFKSIHLLYDGINGQLSNLDLLNTAAAIAGGQMGMGVALQRMWLHADSYLVRLQTMLRGMLSQGLGRSSGPHSSFIPYHIDAITLQAVDDGPEDDMALGRVVESIFRSLNNLLEHFHQSFFFYILMHPNRFVSIGTYLPSAMLVAANFSIMAIALWIRSGKRSSPLKTTDSPTTTSEKSEEDDVKTSTDSQETQPLIVEHDGMKALIPPITTTERELFYPITIISIAHLSGLIPFYLFTNSSPFLMSLTLYAILPIMIHQAKKWTKTPSKHLLQSISLLLLGCFLATLATLNFSLSLFVGLLAAPLSFIGPSLALTSTSTAPSTKYPSMRTLALLIFSPQTLLLIASILTQGGLATVMREAGFGWYVNGLWTQGIVWCVWWPAWVVGWFVI